MNRKLAARFGGAVATGAFVAVSLVGSADAAQPVEQACLGEWLSGEATTNGGDFGQQFSFFARFGSGFLPISNLGEGIQNLQAGTAAAFEEVCNS